MKRAILLVFLLSCLGWQNASAIDCKEFSLTPPGTRCMYELIIPWVAFGGSYEYVLKASNAKTDNTSPSGYIEVFWDVRDLKGKVNVPAYITDNRVGYIVPTGVVVGARPLMPDESAEIHFWYTGAYDSTGQNYLPAPDKVVLGSMRLVFSAFDPAHLRNLVPAQTTLIQKDAEGKYAGQAVQQAKPAAPVWTGPLSETYDKGGNWKTSLNSSAAISNPFNVPVIIDVTLYDEKGGFVAVRTVQVPANGTTPIIFAQAFGDSMFPKGRDFIGTVKFQQSAIDPTVNPAIPGFNVVMFQMVGTSWGSLEVTPVTVQ